MTEQEARDLLNAQRNLPFGVRLDVEQRGQTWAVRIDTDVMTLGWAHDQKTLRALLNRLR